MFIKSQLAVVFFGRVYVSVPHLDIVFPIKQELSWRHTSKNQACLILGV